MCQVSHTYVDSTCFFLNVLMQHVFLTDTFKKKHVDLTHSKKKHFELTHSHLTRVCVCVCVCVCGVNTLKKKHLDI